MPILLTILYGNKKFKYLYKYEISMNILFVPLAYGLNAWWIMLFIIIIMGYFFFLYAEQVKYTRPSLGTISIMLWFIWIIAWILIYFFNMTGVI